MPRGLVAHSYLYTDPLAVRTVVVRNVIGAYPEAAALDCSPREASPTVIGVSSDLPRVLPSFKIFD